MTPKQLQQLDQRLKQWRATHADAESLRTAYRQQVLKFTLSSMALENEPVNPERLAKLLRQPARRHLEQTLSSFPMDMARMGDIL